MPRTRKRDAVDEEGLARVACEYCHKKKKKCTRELPKCSHCKPWPGLCVYPKDAVEPASNNTSEPSSPLESQFSRDSAQLDRLESRRWPEKRLRTSRRHQPVRLAEPDEASLDSITVASEIVVSVDEPVVEETPPKGVPMRKESLRRMSRRFDSSRRESERRESLRPGRDGTESPTTEPEVTEPPKSEPEKPKPARTRTPVIELDSEPESVAERAETPAAAESVEVNLTAAEPTAMESARFEPIVDSPVEEELIRKEPDLVPVAEPATTESREPHLAIIESTRSETMERDTPAWEPMRFKPINAAPVVVRATPEVPTPPGGRRARTLPVRRGSLRRESLPAELLRPQRTIAPRPEPEAASPPIREKPARPMRIVRPVRREPYRGVDGAALPNGRTSLPLMTSESAAALDALRGVSGTSTLGRTQSSRSMVMPISSLLATKSDPASGFSAALAAIDFDRGNRKDFQSCGKAFFLPPVESLYTLAQRCHEVMSRETSMLSSPGIVAIKEALSNPTESHPRGRVLMINHVLHVLAWDDEANQARHALLERGNSQAARAFWWNMETALDDSKLFLRQHEENIQAFFTAASYGAHGFGAPGLAWLLVSHACQQTKAVGLQYPHGDDYAANQRLLRAFWTLFVAEKSVSLAFGRPELLTAWDYQDVPLPDAKYLPRKRQRPEDSSAKSFRDDGGPESFEPCWYFKNIALAKLVSRYSSTRMRHAGEEEARRFRMDLERWYPETMTDLRSAIQAERNRDQQAQGRQGLIHPANVASSEAEFQEMEARLRIFAFQYLHLRMMVAQNLDIDEDDCLATAREMISLVPDLVQSPSGVPEGFVWQLLYFPFAPFLVIFHGILRNPLSRRCEDDLELLASLPGYYSDLGQAAPQLKRVAVKLRDTARCFYRLVEWLAGKRPPHATKSNSESFRAINRVLTWYPLVSHELAPREAGASLQGLLQPPSRRAAPFNSGVVGVGTGAASGGERIFDWFLWDLQEVPAVPVDW